MDKLQELVSDIDVYKQLDDVHQQKFKEIKLSIYEKYNGLIDLFDKLDSSKIEYCVESIRNKVKNGTYSTFIQESGKYTGLYEYVHDKLGYPRDEIEKIILRPNQQRGIQSAIDNDFCCGIHSQATGSGKSVMALKIINEYHKKYSTNTILWICEHIDIPTKLFLTKTEDDTYEINKDNMAKWKYNDIINLEQYHIIEHVINKKNKTWTDEINSYDDDKPLLLIMNRAFMTTKSKQEKYTYRYQEITNNCPKFIIVDECHSAMATETFQLLMHAKYNWKSTIQGLSATPYRKGKIYTKINIPIDTDKLDFGDNRERMIELFHKQSNNTELNILSWFNLKEAIETGIILEPVFHWFKMNTKDKELFDEKEIMRVMNSIDAISKLCKNRKFIVWCRIMSVAESWFTIFRREQSKYRYLKKIKPYIDHSEFKKNHTPDEGYDEFYKNSSGILFCAAMHREGSDIPFLSACVFLDKVSDRGELPFIQCVGRVLRTDIDKTVGHVLDSCDMTSNAKIKSIVNKLLLYYIQFYELTKSDFMLSGECTSESKIRQYEKLMRTLNVVPSEKKIYINMENKKKITLDLESINIKSIEWNKIIPTFESILKENMIFSEYDEFITFKHKCISKGIKDKYEFAEKKEEYELFYVDKEGHKTYIDPKEKWEKLFSNWYTFLDIDTSNYLNTKKKWRKYCHKNHITHDKYLDKCKTHKCLPTMPDELYESFTNIMDELKISDRRK